MTPTDKPASQSNEVFCPYVKDILASRAFHPYRMADQYEQLQQTSGIDFSSCIRVLKLLPVFLDGTPHKSIRKQMALRMQATKADQEAAVIAQLDVLLARHFGQSGEIDLVDDFATPLWRSLSRSILQRDDALLNVVDDIPLLFFASLSLNKRKQINSAITACIDKYGDEIIIDMALASLGVKPFVGSLALSFYDAIEKNCGRLLGTYTLGEKFGKSSLNFVDRIASQSIDVGGKTYAKGQRVRCVTQSSQYSDTENTGLLYGAGNHICLGKAIAQFALTYLNNACKQYPCVITPVSVHMLSDQEPFAMPKHLRVAINVN